MRVKKDLKDLNPTDINFPDGARLFLIDSLCLLGDFGTNAKKLQINKKIFLFFTVSGTVRLKLEQDSPYNCITHLDDLKSLFGDENFIMSSLQYFTTHIYLFLQFFCCVQVQFGFLVNF